MPTRKRNAHGEYIYSIRVGFAFENYPCNHEPRLAFLIWSNYILRETITLDHEL